jgi:fructose-1,6-bisphosphatase/inositol monophosphatase family enzyme
VRNAGGAITDWDGRELTIHSGHRCVVASGSSALHGEVLDRLRRH